MRKWYALDRGPRWPVRGTTGRTVEYCKDRSAGCRSNDRGWRRPACEETVRNRGLRWGLASAPGGTGVDMRPQQRRTLMLMQRLPPVGSSARPSSPGPVIVSALHPVRITATIDRASKNGFMSASSFDFPPPGRLVSRAADNYNGSMCTEPVTNVLFGLVWAEHHPPSRRP